MPLMMLILSADGLELLKDLHIQSSTTHLGSVVQDPESLELSRLNLNPPLYHKNQSTRDFQRSLFSRADPLRIDGELLQRLTPL